MFSKNKRGFTLVELLVVITIIGILTALTLGGARIVQQKAAMARAQGEISALELALERYKIDNGDYPSVSTITVSSACYDGNLESSTVLGKYEGTAPTVNTDGTITGSGDGGKLLFAELMGRTRLIGTTSTKGVDLIADGRVQYIELKPNQVNKSATGANYIKDPWNFPYGYYYKADASAASPGPSSTNTSAKSLFNEVVPDLWSTAGELKAVNPTGTGDEKARYLRWMTNWPNK